MGFFVGLFTRALLSTLPLGSQSAGSAASGCLNWAGACSLTMPGPDGFLGAEWENLNLAVEGNPSSGWKIHNENEENRFTLELTSFGDDGCNVSGKLKMPNWYSQMVWPTNEKESDKKASRRVDDELDVKVEVGTEVMRVLLQPRLQYLDRRSQGKHSINVVQTMHEVTFHKREPRPWKEEGMDGLATFGLFCLLLYCVNVVSGLLMMICLRVQKSSKVVNSHLESRSSTELAESDRDVHTGKEKDSKESKPKEESTYHTQVDVVDDIVYAQLVTQAKNEKEAQEPVADADAGGGEAKKNGELQRMESSKIRASEESHGLAGGPRAWRDRKNRKSRMRGYELHFCALLMPWLPLSLILAGTLHWERDYDRWGIMGCPSTESWDGTPGATIECAFVFHAITVLCLCCLECLGGGQSEFKTIATSPDEVEQKLENLRKGKVEIKMSGRAWHTYTTGCGKDRKTHTVTTWSGAEYMRLNGQNDFSEMVDPKILRSTPLVCITLNLQVRYKTNAEERDCEQQMNAFTSRVRRMDSNHSTERTNVVEGFPESGMLGAKNRGSGPLSFFALLVIPADFFFLGWALRMLMEFWTVHTEVVIVKELEGYTLVAASPVPPQVPASLLPSSVDVAAALATAPVAAPVMNEKNSSSRSTFLHMSRVEDQKLVLQREILKLESPDGGTPEMPQSVKDELIASNERGLGSPEECTGIYYVVPPVMPQRVKDRFIASRRDEIAKLEACLNDLKLKIKKTGYPALVTVPEGAMGGTTIQVSTANGLMNFIVPEGLTPGETFRVQVPPAPEAKAPGAPDDQKPLLVTVPEGAMGGTTVQIFIASGLMNVVVPEGLTPGQTFQVQAPGAPDDKKPALPVTNPSEDVDDNEGATAKQQSSAVKLDDDAENPNLGMTPPETSAGA